MNLATSMIFILILSSMGVLLMIFAATISFLDVRKLQILERKIKNKSNIINAQDHQDFHRLNSQLIQLRNQFLKLDSQSKKRLMSANEALIREAQEKIESHVNLEPAMKKKLSELLRQESDLGKTDYMIKIIKLLLIAQ